MSGRRHRAARRVARWAGQNQETMGWVVQAWLRLQGNGPAAAHALAERLQVRSEAQVNRLLACARPSLHSPTYAQDVAAIAAACGLSAAGLRSLLDETRHLVPAPAGSPEESAESPAPPASSESPESPVPPAAFSRVA